MALSLKLRHKLALSISMAALLPVIVGTSIGTRAVLRSLEEGLRTETARSTAVAANLIAERTRTLESHVARLARSTVVVRAFTFDQRAPLQFALSQDPVGLPYGKVELLTPSGEVRWGFSVGARDEQLQGFDLASASGEAMLDNRRLFEAAKSGYARATIMSTERPVRSTRLPAAANQKRLVVRAIAPIVSDEGETLGLLAYSVPMDRHYMWDLGKSLGLETIVVAGIEGNHATELDVVSSLRTPILSYEPQIFPVELLRNSGWTNRAEVRFVKRSLGNREYTIGFAPIRASRTSAGQLGRAVGLIGVALPRDSLADARRRAALTLALGGVSVAIFALLFALFLARRLTRPLTHLHQDALAVARGETRILRSRTDNVGNGDEIADLTSAFSQMTESLASFSYELEERVESRTADLMRSNSELASALAQLKQAQAQLVLSDRLAGLGGLVAGIAHEINSPAAAIRSAALLLSPNVNRILLGAVELASVEPLAVGDDLERKNATHIRDASWMAQLVAASDSSADARLPRPVESRRLAKRLESELLERALSPEVAHEISSRLASVGALQNRDWLTPFLQTFPPSRIQSALNLAAELFTLTRNVAAIRSSIESIRRIVLALKSYSHLDEARIVTADLHDGIENTLVILRHEFAKYDIVVQRSFAEVPPVPVYVDELNQVWTNLLHNAVQAISGQGVIVIETKVDGNEAVVTIQDSGPGIPDDVMPRIFEPFFTTKKAGEGTGLGLGIVQRIIEKHGGAIDVSSRPGCTRFSVRLSLSGPPAQSSDVPNE